MTKVSKILTVFVFFTSVAFMGLTLMGMYAGVNWRTKANDLVEFTIEQSGAEPQSPYTVKQRKDGVDEDVGSGKILPEAIVVAQKKLVEQQQEELTKLTDETPKVDQRRKEAVALIAEDLTAMQARAAKLEVELERLTAEIKKTAAQANTQTKSANDQYVLGRLRREEWVIMKNQLEELRSQRLGLTTEKQRLRDLLYQSQGNLALAERRQKLLKQEVGADASYDSAPDVGTGSEVEMPADDSETTEEVVAPDEAPAEGGDAEAPATEEESETPATDESADPAATDESETEATDTEATTDEAPEGEETPADEDTTESEQPEAAPEETQDAESGSPKN